MAKTTNKSKVAKKGAKAATSVKPAKTLTAQQVRFCEEYVIDRNGTQAAIRAGYSAKTAQEQSSRLLSNVIVRQHIDSLLSKLSEETGITAAKVIREVGAIALCDPRKLFNEDGSLKRVVDLDDTTAAAVASVEVDVLYEGAGKDRVAVGTTTKIKMWDKNSAAEKLMRHLGLFEVDNKQKTDPLAELLSLVQERGNRLPIKDQT